MIVKGLGCDCYQQDSDGNCLDPQPCAGDTTQAFDPITGLAVNSLSPSTTSIVTATGPMVATTTNTTNATTAVVNTTSCTETYISGVCDYFLYIGAAIGGLYLLSMFSGSHRR